MVSLVILADDQPNWRPCQFIEELLRCRVQFDFPVCKLLDLVPVARQAIAAGQPSAVMVVANWAAQQTRRDMVQRGRWKWDLTRCLHEVGFERKDILELYRLIDWLLRLPEDLEKAHREQVRNYEDQEAMRYVTSIERMAREEGQAEEGRELVLRLLRRRLGALAPALEQRVRALQIAQLESLAEALLDFTGPADLEKWLQALE